MFIVQLSFYQGYHLLSLSAHEFLTFGGNVWRWDDLWTSLCMLLHNMMSLILTEHCCLSIKKCLVTNQSNPKTIFCGLGIIKKLLNYIRLNPTQPDRKRGLTRSIDNSVIKHIEATLIWSSCSSLMSVALATSFHRIVNRWRKNLRLYRRFVNDRDKVAKSNG